MSTDDGGQRRRKKNINMGKQGLMCDMREPEIKVLTGKKEELFSAHTLAQKKP